MARLAQLVRWEQFKFIINNNGEKCFPSGLQDGTTRPLTPTDLEREAAGDRKRKDERVLRDLSGRCNKHLAARRFSEHSLWHEFFAPQQLLSS